jgi:hypothetical protein
MTAKLVLNLRGLKLDDHTSTKHSTIELQHVSHPNRRSLSFYPNIGPLSPSGRGSHHAMKDKSFRVVGDRFAAKTVDKLKKRSWPEASGMEDMFRTSREGDFTRGIAMQVHVNVDVEVNEDWDSYEEETPKAYP